MKNDVILSEVKIDTISSIRSEIWCMWYAFRAYLRRADEASKRLKLRQLKKQENYEAI